VSAYKHHVDTAAQATTTNRRKRNNARIAAPSALDST
jgi:hypothetical protein